MSKCAKEIIHYLPNKLFQTARREFLQYNYICKDIMKDSVQESLFSPDKMSKNIFLNEKKSYAWI